MFRIGEFAQIAQVSSRQLRHYDRLGLLRPAHIDGATGYRHYSIDQLPRLNRILALKELGLALEQIGALLDDGVSPADLKAMLVMKRAQITQSMVEEEARLRHIETRIAQIEHEGAIRDYDVVVKSVPAAPFLALHARCEGFEEAGRLLILVAQEGAVHLRPGLRKRFVVVAHNDFEDDELDLEIGFMLTRPTNRTLRIPGNDVLTPAELPAVAEMATIVRSGPDYESHRAFGVIGGWIAANNYRIAGPCREVFLEPPTPPPRPEGPLVEIQFPVRRAV